MDQDHESALLRLQHESSEAQVDLAALMRAVNLHTEALQRFAFTVGQDMNDLRLALYQVTERLTGIERRLQESTKEPATRSDYEALLDKQYGPRSRRGR